MIAVDVAEEVSKRKWHSLPWAEEVDCIKLALVFWGIANIPVMSGNSLITPLNVDIVDLHAPPPCCVWLLSTSCLGVEGDDTRRDETRWGRREFRIRANDTQSREQLQLKRQVQQQHNAPHQAFTFNSLSLGKSKLQSSVLQLQLHYASLCLQSNPKTMHMHTDIDRFHLLHSSFSSKFYEQLRDPEKRAFPTHADPLTYS